VIAALHYAFGLSPKEDLWPPLGGCPRIGAHLKAEFIRKTGWIRFLEAKLNLAATPSGYPPIATDEGVVKCSRRPIYVWVAVGAYTKQSIWF